MPQRLTETVAAPPPFFDLEEDVVPTSAAGDLHTPAPLPSDTSARDAETLSLPVDMVPSPAAPRRRMGSSRIPAPRLPAGFAWRKRAGEKPRPELCLNCQTRVVGAFCHECGQENVTYVVSFGELLREIYGEFVQVDSRMVRTVAALIARPGLLTNEFLNGKRVRYLSPFKMYIVVSALFFLLFTLFNPMPFDDDDIKTGPVRKVLDSAFKSGSDDKAKTTNAVKTAKPDSVVKAPPAPKPPLPSAVKPSVQAARKTSGAKPVKTEEGLPIGRNFNLSAFGVNMRSLPTSVHGYRDQQKKLPFAKRHGFFQSFIALKLIRFEASPADTLRGIIYATLPNIMVFMLPLFALLLKIMYLRSKRLYVEHFIFVLHTHTFMFVALALVILSPWAGLKMALALTVPAYNLMALRAVYRQSFPKTLLKGFLLWNGYSVLLLFAGFLGLALAIFSTLLSPG